MKIKNCIVVFGILVSISLNAFSETLPPYPALPKSGEQSKLKIYLAPKNQISICPIEGGDCQNAAMPKKIGDVKFIAEGPYIEGAKISWVAITKTNANLCALVAGDAAAVTCTKLPQIAAAVKNQSLNPNKPLTVDAVTTLYKGTFKESNNAINTIQSRLKNASSGGLKTLEVVPCDECDDPTDGGGGGGGGGGDGGGWDSGGGEYGGPGDPLPPGAAPGDSPTQISCYAQAYSAWLIMDDFCSSQSSPSDRQICHDTKWRLYIEEKEYCATL